MKIIEHTDVDTGARVWQLGEDPTFSNHFYTDNPSFSADGKQFIFMAGPEYFNQCQAMLCDIPSRTIQPASEMRDIQSAVMSLAKPEVYFTVKRADVLTIYRARLANGETTEIARLPGVMANYGLGAITPRGDKYATGVTWTNGSTAVLEFDLASGAYEIILEASDLHNPHMNYSADGRWLSIQRNHTERSTTTSGVVPVTDQPGLKNRIYVWDCKHRAMHDIPLIPDTNASIQGHQCWAGRDVLMFTVITSVRGRWQGAIWAARPDDKSEWLVSDAFDWRHPSATMDGSLLACDDWNTHDIYVIDVKSGKHELICHSNTIDFDKLHNAPAWSHQEWHTHPTIGPDGRAILFNSTRRTGTPHGFVVFRPV